MNLKTVGIALLVLIAASFAFIGNAAAATYTVNPGDSIQAAINGAVDGDTIIITDGDYVENVLVDKSVAIISEGVYEHYVEEGYYAEGFLWWIYYDYSWTYEYEYDGAVSVAAAEDSESVFTVTADDVLIQNIQVQINDAGIYEDFNTYWYIFWDYTLIEWTYTRLDNPMTITGAVRSDAAGIMVDGATGTQLINLITYDNDNGIVLNGASDTYIEDVEMLDNNKEGLVATGCDGITLVDSVVVDSGKRGVEIEDSANVEIDTVLVLDSNKDGIRCINVDGLMMTQVCVEDSAKHGVDLDDCTAIDMTYMLIAGSGRSGLTMNDCDGTTVANTEIAYNTDYGLKTHNVFNVDFVNNYIHDNGQDEKHFNSAPPVIP